MKEKILKGPTTECMAKMGVGEYFWKAAEEYGERICQIDAYTYKKESFDTVRKRALRIAIQLRKMGVQPKNTVVFICSNDLDNIIPPLAALFLGAYACSIEPQMQLFDMKYLLTQVDPKVIFVTKANLQVLEKEICSMTNRPQICVIGESQFYPQMYEMEKFETEEETNFKPFKADVQDTAFIVFSSGTTSFPKGIYVSHLGAMSIACHHPVDQHYFIDNPVVQFTTLYWISGVWIFTFNLMYGQPRIVGPNISAIKFLQLVNKYKVPNGFIFGRIFYDLVNTKKDVFNFNDISSLKLLTVAGTSINPEMILDLRKLMPSARIVQTYGATEIGTSPTDWSSVDKNEIEKKVASVGRPSRNIEIKIVDVETREPLGTNNQGELLIRSPYRMNGYCKRNSAEVFDKDGFLKTGDLAYYDKDSYIYVIDRIDDIFKTRSHKIIPISIETVLLKHPDVLEAVVFGIPHPAEYHLPAACILLKENSNTTAQDIFDFVKANMSELHWLRGGIKFLEEIPKTTNGKISRKAVKKLFISI